MENINKWESDEIILDYLDGLLDESEMVLFENEKSVNKKIQNKIEQFVEAKEAVILSGRDELLTKIEKVSETYNEKNQSIQ